MTLPNDESVMDDPVTASVIHKRASAATREGVPVQHSENAHDAGLSDRLNSLALSPKMRNPGKGIAFCPEDHTTASAKHKPKQSNDIQQNVKG